MSIFQKLPNFFELVIALKMLVCGVVPHVSAECLVNLGRTYQETRTRS
jgi:hypothetical protein